MLILAGDIGGTNTRLSLHDDSKKVIQSEVFPSGDYSSLSDILRKFLKEKVSKACFGIAGPIKNNICKATNLPWEIDGNKVGKELGIEKVFLINDLLANAYGIRALKEDEFFVLNAGKPQEGNAVLVSAGTGLGEAGLFWNGKEHIPFPSEGGHADFSPRTKEEVDLFLYLMKEYGHVSYERLVSGPGIYNIYRFLVESLGKKGFEEKIEEELLPKAITKAGLEGGVESAVLALEWFISLYGAEAGNVALKFLALSGVYIGGGIAPKMIEKMKDGTFMKAFVEKGRFKELMQDIPVKIILNDQAALLGALEFALLKD